METCISGVWDIFWGIMGKEYRLDGNGFGMGKQSWLESWLSWNCLWEASGHNEGY